MFEIAGIDKDSKYQVELVAERMRLTLGEVLGQKGYSMYTLDWLINRVEWHLDIGSIIGQVFLARDKNSAIVGHIIVRKEIDENFKIGLISTIYVVPEYRKLGIANKLLDTGERWLAEKNIDFWATHTDDANQALINLLRKRGYNITFRSTENKMVRLSKPFIANTLLRTIKNLFVSTKSNLS